MRSGNRRHLRLGFRFINIFFSHNEGYPLKGVGAVFREIPLGIPLDCLWHSDGRDRGAAVAACLSGVPTLQFLGVLVLALLPKRAVTLQPRRTHLGFRLRRGRRARGPGRLVLIPLLLFGCRKLAMREFAFIRVILVLAPPSENG